MMSMQSINTSTCEVFYKYEINLSMQNQSANFICADISQLWTGNRNQSFYQMFIQT